MRLPAFFARVPRLRVHDPLAELLGSAENGVFEYGYEDAVRLAGHSCPVVASAYWLTLRALQMLYPGTLPQRGGVRVEFQTAARSGSTGVVACVVQMLTGAAGSSGFKGLAGRFSRAGLQRFAPEIPLAMRFTRIDTGDAVDAAAELSLLPEPPALDVLLQRCVHHATPEDLRELGLLWQKRVERLLGEYAHDPSVFVLRPVVHRPRGWLRHPQLLERRA
jgi:hypothetical protein